MEPREGKAQRRLIEVGESSDNLAISGEGVKFIKVAIMGAGLSGLVCATVLEQNGIFPTIFEKREQVGDRFINAEIFLSLLSKPVNDCIAYFADTYNIFLQPVSYIKNLILTSERQQAVISGHLGFCNLRGRDPKSFENQLARRIQSEIIYNSQHTYEQLLHDFTHVVMATGDADYAAKMGNYRQDLAPTLDGFTVAGDFDRYTVRAWLDNRFAPNGYGYLIPISEQEANIVLWLPQHEKSKIIDSRELLELFYHRVCSNLNQKLKVTSHFEIQEYMVGICHYPRIGNTYFTGNCFGAITPYLGFGQFVSILTGIYAALDLSGQGCYSELTKPLRQNHQNSLVLRHAWEQLDNRGFDNMVKFFNGYLGNKIFNTQHFDVIKFASYLARPWIRDFASPYLRPR